MAVKIGQELTELTFAQEKSLMAGGTYGYDPAQLDNFTKTFEVYERELKRVFGSLVTTVTTIDENTKQAINKVYVPREYEAEALGIRKSVFDTRQGAGIDDSSVTYFSNQGAHFLQTQKEIKGMKAQQFAKEEIIDKGGKIRHVAGTANKDMMVINIPVSDTDLANMKKADITRFITGATPEANKASRAEQTERNRREREAQLERDTKLQQRQFKENKRKTLQQTREAERQQKEKEKLEEREAKEKIQSRKQTLGTIGKIVTALGILVDITRRILTSVISFGQQTSRQQTKANTLTTGLADVRALNYLDTSLGLDKGTNVQAQEDFRQAFGNTANINTEALKWLAMVMGDEVGQAVQMGLGQDNPAKLVEMSLDAFYERWQKGEDQFGNQVGQDKARRALVTVLEQVSPSIARIFERMVEEQTSGINAGEITSYRQLQSFFLQGTAGMDTADWEKVSLLGKEADQLKATFQSLTDTIKSSLLLALGDFIGKLNNLHIGQTTSEALEEDISDMDWLSNRYNELEERKQNIQKDFTDVIRKGNFSSMSNMSIDEVIDWAQKEVTFGMSEVEERSVTDAKNAMQFITSEPALYEKLREYYAIKAMQNKVIEYGRGKNPNADKVALGDIALTQMKDTAILELSRLGMGTPYGITGSEYDFDLGSRDFTVPYYYYDHNGVRQVGYREMSADERRNYILSNPWHVSMFKEEKQGAIYRASDEFFEQALYGTKGNQWQTALNDTLKKYNKYYYGKDKNSYLTKYKIKKLYDTASNPNENENVRQEARRTLANIFMFGDSPTDVTKVSNTTSGLIQQMVRDMPDEYGLTQDEYAKIWSGIDTGTAKVRASLGEEPTIAKIIQGDTAGTLKIVLAKEEDGTVKELTTIDVPATMREGFEKTINLDVTNSITNLNK